MNRVEMQADPHVGKIVGHSESFMISDQFLPLYVRQIAIHANLASHVQPRNGKEADGSAPYVSNWVERLKQLKRIGLKAKEHVTSSSHSFTTSHEHVVGPGLGVQGIRTRSNTMHANMASASNSSTMSTSDHELNGGGDNVLPDDFTQYA